MGSRFKVKKRENASEAKPRSSISARTKMAFLLLWGGLCLGLYLVLSRYYAMTPVIVAEILLFLGLCVYFVLGILIHRESVKNGNEGKDMVRLLDKQKAVLIFIIPLIFVILIDFIITMVRMTK